MKNFRKMLLVLALIMTVSVLSAQTADPKLNAQNLAYSRLASIKYISLGTASATTWSNNTATGTNSTYYGVGTVKPPLQNRFYQCFVDPRLAL